MLPVLALLFAQTAPMPEPVDHASTADCEIIVAIGKAELNWGQKPPIHDFFPEFARDGGGTYLEDCAWSAFGVAAPRIGGPQSTRSFFITRPKYDATLTHATATMEIALKGEKSPFIMQRNFELELRDGHWRLSRTIQGPIT